MPLLLVLTQKSFKYFVMGHFYFSVWIQLFVFFACVEEATMDGHRVNLH